MIMVAGLEIDGNDVEVSMLSSAKTIAAPSLLRDTALNSYSVERYKYTEVEVLSGKRILVRGSNGTFEIVPLNNDDAYIDTVYASILLSINATAVNANDLDLLVNAYKASMEMYTLIAITLNKVNDSSLTYNARKTFYNDCLAIDSTNLEVSVPGLPTGYDWEFTEASGLNISYWTNGPYADLKIQLNGQKEITF